MRNIRGRFVFQKPITEVIPSQISNINAVFIQLIVTSLGLRVFVSLDKHGVEELSAQKRGNISWNV